MENGQPSLPPLFVNIFKDIFSLRYLEHQSALEVTVGWGEGEVSEKVGNAGQKDRTLKGKSL